jgi:hypothetical protein
MRTVRFPRELVLCVRFLRCPESHSTLTVGIFGPSCSFYSTLLRDCTCVIWGSGSFEQDSPLGIVAMEKEEQARFMHDQRLGKGQRHAHKTSQTLAQGVVPALHMSCFSSLFTNGCMLLLRDHRRIGRPEIREAAPVPIPLWNGFPQPLTRLFAPIPDRIGNHLPRLATEGNPNPGVVYFFKHKRPDLVQFQDRGRGILWIRGEQRCTQRGELSYFF